MDKPGIVLIDLDGLDGPLQFVLGFHRQGDRVFVGRLARNRLVFLLLPLRNERQVEVTAEFLLSYLRTSTLQIMWISSVGKTILFPIISHHLA